MIGLNNWNKFLNTCFDGDIKRINLLQEWMGYSTTCNDLSLRKSLLLTGLPRSGKSTVIAVMRELMGRESYEYISLDDLDRDFILENCIDKDHLFIVDSHASDKNLIRFKQITGGDELIINRKYKPVWHGRLNVKFTMESVVIPEFTKGILSTRVIVLPFNVSFAGKEDLTLLDKLLKELPFIEQWVSDGLKRLETTGEFTTI